MRPASSTAYLRWIAPLLWMALIFVGSTDVLSHSHTSRFIEPFLRWLFHGSLSPEAIDEIHLLIRKAGHLGEYGVLCILYWWALATGPGARRAGMAIILAACFAASDEFHQSFIPSRTAKVSDVMIDTAGAAFGLAVFLTARYLFKRRLATLRRPDRS